jgi:hypothetical protein
VDRFYNLLLEELMMIYVFSATITRKYGVWCKKEYNLWFGAKELPTYGVICYFLGPRGPSTIQCGASQNPWTSCGHACSAMPWHGRKFMGR